MDNSYRSSLKMLLIIINLFINGIKNIRQKKPQLKSTFLSTEKYQEKVQLDQVIENVLRK